MKWTRLQLLGGLAGAAATWSQDGAGTAGFARLCAAVKKRTVMAVPPDGRHLLMGEAGANILGFRQGWGPTTKGNGASRLLTCRLPGLEVVGVTRFPDIAFSACYTGNGKKVFILLVSPTGGGRRLIQMDVNDGVLSNEREAEGNVWSWFFAGPDGLIDQLYEVKGSNIPRQFTTMVGDRRITASWIPPGLPKPKYSEVCPAIGSSDRKMFVHPVGAEAVVCRNASLEVKWTWSRVEARRLSVYRLAVSATGRWVAVGLRDFDHRDENNCVLVLDGLTGHVVKEFLADGHHALAISPDGSRIAVGSFEDYQKWPGGYSIGVWVHDAANPKERAWIDHGRVSEIRSSLDARFEGGNAGLSFTPDGRYLIVSAQNTKVWELSAVG